MTAISDSVVLPKVYRESIVVDCLNVMALTSDNVENARRAGVTALNYTAVRPRSDLLEAMRDLARVREAVEAHEDLSMILSAEDIRRAKAEGTVGIIFGMQDAKPIGDELAFLRTFHDLGIRIIQLTHNTQSWIGTGCIEPDNGLTRFGRRVVEEMNRLGILIDIAHCGPRTTLDAIESSERPVICSHSNPLAVCDSPRNKTDDVLERLAQAGGVIGIAFWSPMSFRDRNRRPTLEDVLACFDHALELIGSEHVAIGTDLCDGLYTTATREQWEVRHGTKGDYPEVTGILGDWYGLETWFAEQLDSIAKLPDLARALIERGFDEDQMRCVLGENFIRVFERATA